MNNVFGFFPVPKEKGNSLFVIIAENPEYNNQGNVNFFDIVKFIGDGQEIKIKVQNKKWDVFCAVAKPGIYYVCSHKIVSSNNKYSLERARVVESFTIKPDTVYLYSKKLQFYATRNGVFSVFLSKVTPFDRKKAAEVLSDYIGFEEWIGKRFAGFSPYEPSFPLERKTYKVSINSNPAGASVILDLQDWGKTPVVASLSKGKHLLQLKKPGFLDYKTFIKITTDVKINFNLSLVQEESKPDTATQTLEKDKFSILVMPFLNIGDIKYDSFKPIIQDTLFVLFSKETKLKPVIPPDNLEQPLIKNTNKLDFSFAEKKGVELLVYGQYMVKNGVLFVHADLWDVKSERIKTGVLYSGKPGLEIFESIDLMANDFIHAVSKVLPEIGKDIIEKKQVVTEKVVFYEKKISKKHIIMKRFEKKNSIGFFYYFGGRWAIIKDLPFYNNERTEVGFDWLYLGINYAHNFNNYFGWALKSTLGSGYVGVYEDYETELGKNPYAIDFSFYSGPSFYFNAYRTDIYFSLLGYIGYGNKIKITKQFEGDVVTRTYGPFFPAGIFLDSGFNFYINKRLSEKPRFIQFGFMYGILDYDFERNFKNPVKIPLDVWLYLGYGWRR